MNVFSLAVRGAAVGILAGLLHAQDPVLTTPGTATWLTETTSTGMRTVFTIGNNTVFDWAKLNVANGSELVFNFVGGGNVINFLGGTGTHVIDGTVTSNGIVAFFSPAADLEINGSITARGVTLATLNADPTTFGSASGYQLEGSNGWNYLSVNGAVTATDGDVLLAGERVIIGDTARIQSTQAVRIGGGRDISVAGSGERRLRENSGMGFVLHLGETRASRIEVAAGREINNQGRLDAGNGRIFMAVGSEGVITNDSSGIIVGNAVFDGAYNADGVVLIPDEGDAVPVVSEGNLTIPALTRPDGSQVSTGGRITNSPPTHASGDTGRDVIDSERTMPPGGGGRTGRVLSNKVGAAGGGVRGASETRRDDRQVVTPGRKKPLLQRSSFFGMRGGDSAVPKR